MFTLFNKTGINQPIAQRTNIEIKKRGGRIGPEIATAVLARDGVEAGIAEGGARWARAAGAADQAGAPSAQRHGGRLGRHGRAPETATGPSQLGSDGGGGGAGG